MVGSTAKVQVWILLLASLFPALTEASKWTEAARSSARVIRKFKSNLPDNYQSLSAKKKLDILWKNCLEDTTGVGHSSELEACVVFFRDMNDTFDHVSDERPWGRKKPIHATGPVVKARFDAAGSTPYTGMFKGCSNVLLRFAPGVAPKPGILLTGVSAKFLRNGMPSGNLLALRKTGTQKDTMNWFQDQMSHLAAAVDPPIGWALTAKFKSASQFAVDIGLSELSDYDPAGKKVSKPKFPFEMFLRPNPKLGTETLETMVNLKSGTKLYDVYAKENEGSAQKKVGSITTTSKMTNSKYGDLKLFFQHQRREEDLARLAKSGSCPYTGN